MDICQSKLTHVSTRQIIQVILGVILLIGGCIIYIVWRSEDTNLNVWCRIAGLDFLIDYLRVNLEIYDPGTFVRNSLPDGLYCGAYILIMDGIWSNSVMWKRICMALLMPVVALVHEMLQLFGMMSGTFDSIDMLCYSAPVVLYILSLYFFNPNTKFNSLTT